MKKRIINIMWGAIVCMVLLVILMVISSLILGMIMPDNTNFEAAGTKLAIPMFIVAVVITIKIIKAGILPGTKKKE